MIGTTISYMFSSLVKHATIYFLAKKVIDERVMHINVLILNVREKNRFAKGTLLAPMQFPTRALVAS
jgi:hypothetical protein